MLYSVQLKNLYSYLNNIHLYSIGNNVKNI